MEYSNFLGLDISRLGFGIMRLPETTPDLRIDEKKGMEMVAYAYENGVNYFDTAWFYHAGESERFIGKALARYPRDTWVLGSKWPGNFVSIEEGRIKLQLGTMRMADEHFSTPTEIFEKQLENCGVDFFDLYMLHNLCESTYDLYTDKKIGIIDCLLEQKRKGRIKHFGFSTHARPETLDSILNQYDCFEFALIQLNYLDWSLQEAGKKYEVLTRRGLPIMVMEPMRGGKLANLSEKEAAMLKAVRPDDSPAAWSFRFLQSLPNVAVVVSGMSTMEQLEENIDIFSKGDLMTDSEKDVLWQLVENMGEFVPCTSCKYCCCVCPQKLDIPMLISSYNETLYGDAWPVEEMFGVLSDKEKPQACINCGACNPFCPQNIDIPATMEKFAIILKRAESPEKP